MVRVLRAAVLFVAVGVAGSAGALPPPSANRPVTPTPARSLASRFGLAVVDRLLASGAPDDRIRAVERLGTIEGSLAADRLVQILEPGPRAEDRRVRLSAIRALSGSVGYEPARQVLAKAMGLPSNDKLFLLGQRTAALVLSRSGDPSAVGLVVAALHQGNAAARAALLLYPPEAFSVLWSGKDKITPSLCSFFGDLGDLRAVPLLEDVLRMPAAAASASGRELDRDVRIAAALALARLGATSELPVARIWLDSSDPAWSMAGLEVLVTAGSSDAAEAVVRLLRRPATRARASELSLSVEKADLERALGGWIEDAPLSASVLGWAGGRAAALLGGALSQGDARGEAAFALARAPGDEAWSILRTALENESTRRSAARAAALRARFTGDEPPWLRVRLAGLLASREPMDRAAGSFGLALLGGQTLSLLSSMDPVVVRAAASTLLVAGPDAIRSAAARLATEKDAATRSALGLALAVAKDEDVGIATATLAGWAEEDEILGPLAAVALGARERAETEDRLDRLLASPSALIRAHAAAALGASPRPDAAVRLGRAWSFETSEAVRRSIARALAQRTEPSRTEPLLLIAGLDPDPAAREIARAALASSRVAPLAPVPSRSRLLPGEVLWTTAPSFSLDTAAQGAVRTGVVVDGEGLALPVVSDPSGLFAVPGIRRGPGSFQLASGPSADKASPHEPVEGPPGARSPAKAGVGARP
jgi:hypothetical protein